MRRLLLHSTGSSTWMLFLTGMRLFAGQGDLDLTFGTGGRATTEIRFPGTADVTNAGHGLAIQNDGKIFLAGYSATARRSYDFSVLRYHPSGILDSGFNSTGYVTTDISGDDYGYSAAVQKDGKVLVAGVTGTAFALLRYNADGSLDSSFNSTGKVITDFGQMDSARSVAVQADGKILLAGVTGPFGFGNNYDFAVARYHPDGGLDTTFGSGGMVVTDFGDGATVNGIVVQADGRIIVAGSSVTTGVSSVIAVARYSANGSLDTSFNTSGKLTLNLPGGWSQANSAVIQHDGKILVAGKTGPSGEVAEDFAIIRLNRDGSLDPTFGGDGVVTTNFGGSEQANDIAVQHNGKIVAAGDAYTSGGQSFALARYNSDGSLDPAFRGTGKVISKFTEGDYCKRVAVQKDGNILAGGYSTYTEGGSHISAFTAVRYLGDPPPAIGIEHPEGTVVTIPVGFGEVVAGTADERILTIRNNSDAPLAGLSVTLTGPGMPGEFFVEPPQTNTLQPGDTATANVTFSPAAPGLRTAFIVIAADGHAPATVGVEGTQPLQEIVVEQPAGAGLISGSATSVDFGPVAGGVSRELTFTIRNTGGTALTGLAVNKAATGTPAQFTIGTVGTTSLPPRSSATFAVRFTPAAAVAATATVLITSNDEDENPFEINLAGSLATAIEAWRQTNFGSPFDSGAGADLYDADSDGLLNLLEFSLGTDPNSKTLPPGNLELNGNRLEFTYARPKAPLAEVSHRVEWSDSLSGTWSTVGSASEILADDGITQQVKLGVPAGTAGRRFVRLRVTKL